MTPTVRSHGLDWRVAMKCTCGALFEVVVAKRLGDDARALTVRRVARSYAAHRAGGCR